MSNQIPIIDFFSGNGHCRRDHAAFKLFNKCIRCRPLPLCFHSIPVPSFSELIFRHLSDTDQPVSARSVSIFCFLLYHYTAKGGIEKSPALQAKRITARQRLDLKAPGRKDHGGDVDKHAKQFPALKVIRLITIAVPADLIFVQLHLKLSLIHI